MKHAVIYVLLLLITIPVMGGNNKDADFTLWQLPSQVNTIGNSYVFKMNDGKIVVMDGGVKEEAPYLRGFLAALGNNVEYWFVSHPHPDHIGALNEILLKPAGIIINNICLSEYSASLCELESDYKSAAVTFYKNLHSSGIHIINITKPGAEFKVNKTVIKILGVTNEEIKDNPYNNSSMVIKVFDDKKSVLFLADLGKEGGDKLLNGQFGDELNCDYLQMAHHGQNGVRDSFYKTIKFTACLWPTPLWLYNNDIGKGYNTAQFETVKTRELMNSIGIREHFVSCMGLYKIE
jgi:beta-lactamase superfamily II metal-dependent hydrolase